MRYPARSPPAALSNAAAATAPLVRVVRHHIVGVEIIDCLYCGKPGPPSREHVLTRAFAGGGEDWLLVDAVCRRCNTLVFSGDERAWTAAPPFADARCGLGPVGRTRRGRAYVFHPAERIFLSLAGDSIAYEVDVLPRFATRYRPQLIDMGDRIISGRRGRGRRRQVQRTSGAV